MAKKSNKLPIAKSNVAAVEYKRTKEDEARERRYRAEDGLRTLQRADEIKRDKQLCNDIKALAKEQVKAAQKFIK